MELARITTTSWRESIYKTLDVENYEIRMLTILPGPPDSIVGCRLQETSLINPGTYVALSYCWGDPGVRSDILVNDHQISVTSNLANALRQLRLLGIVRIWVDALCINQDDRQEKSHQIRNMKNVYSKANEVFSWLGEQGSDRSVAAMMFLESICSSIHDGGIPSIPGRGASGEEDDVPLLLNHELADYPLVEPLHVNCSSVDQLSCQHGSCLLKRNFRALADLFKRPYWRRVWIIQEVAVSARVHILCGNVRISLDNLNKVTLECRKFELWDADIASAYLYFQKIMEFRDLYRTSQISLCKAITYSRDFLSTDPRDKIFALLGLCYDGPELLPTPNYQQPLEVVFKDLTRALIHKNKCLDVILMNTEAAVTVTDLPSWTPDWLNSHISEEGYELASHRRISSYSNTITTSINDENLLQASGVIIDIVSTTTSPTNRDQAVSSTETLVNYPERYFYTPQQQHTYYKNKTEVITAICSCLKTKDESLSVTELSPLILTTTSDITPYILALEKLQDAYCQVFMNSGNLHALQYLALPSKNYIDQYLESSLQDLEAAFEIINREIRRFDLSRCFRLALPITTHSVSQRKGDLENEHLIRINRWASEWFKQNESFTIQGKALTDWLGEVTPLRPVSIALILFGIFYFYDSLIVYLAFWLTRNKLTIDHVGQSLIIFLIAFTLMLIVFVCPSRLAFRVMLWNALGMCSFALIVACGTPLVVACLIFFFGVCIMFVRLMVLLRRLPQEHVRSILPLFRESHRLFSCSRGLLGVASSEVAAGDKICFLADCTTAVVLREVRMGNRVQYRVVGKAFVYLSASDRKKYQGFLEEFDSQERAEWMQMASRNGLLHQFELV